MAYRVDNIPLLLKPFFFLYSYVLAFITYFLFVLAHVTCRIERKGDDYAGNAVYTIWHENLLLYFTVYIRYRQNYIWMNHPLWYMKPVHLILKIVGVKKIFLGSTGHGGKGALEKVIEYLEKGYNTLVACDGPSGPYKEMKSGILEMSKEAGVPVISIKFTASKYFTLPGWDKKQVPYPFTKVTAEYQTPVFVNEENYQESAAIISEGMG